MKKDVDWGLIRREARRVPTAMRRGFFAWIRRILETDPTAPWESGQ